MPLSKHRKKGQTARQFRKKRNIRHAQYAAEMKTQKLGVMRAMRMMQGELGNL